MRRREFLGGTAAAAGLVWAYSPRLAFSQSTDARIELLLDEHLGTISPNIYGHFVENLSGVVYDGIWVGEKSKVPNVGGIRKELIDEMRKIKPGVVRFPGGCFADSYDWRDGVGPTDKRPRRTNFWSGGEAPAAPDTHRYDPNQFGTNEFAQFCRQIGGEPYFAANLRSLPAEQFYRWVEYCNSPAGSTTLADDRAAAGFKDPFNVKYWGVGNEAWGCGGNFLPQEYATEFRRFTAWVPGYKVPLKFIGSGPDSANWAWTRGFFEDMVRKGKGQLDSLFGWALHHYAWNMSRGKTSDWNKAKGDAVNFDVTDWCEILRQGEQVETLINGHWQIMGEFDPEHKVKLVVDEWGPWYKSGSELTPGDQLEQLPTLRDGVFSGMTLDIFNRNPEKVTMACCAQLINCLNSLYLAHEDRFCVTPVGHVFAMYAAHQGGESVRAEFSAPAVHYDRDGQAASFWGLRGSASLHDKQLIVTAVNPNVKDACETQIGVRGARVTSAEASVLSASDIHARNTFEQRQAVAPKAASVRLSGDSAMFSFPAASVTKLTLQLG